MGARHHGEDSRRGSGYAESLDGIDWTKRADPVLEPGSYPGAWDPQTVGNPYVVFDGSSYHMWYNGGAETSTTADLSIGYAFSSDGIHWSKHRDNPVVELSGQIVFHAPVVLDGSTWRMWYSHWDGSTIGSPTPHQTAAPAWLV